jgi:hypothetical protein
MTCEDVTILRDRSASVHHKSRNAMKTAESNPDIYSRGFEEWIFEPDRFALRMPPNRAIHLREVPEQTKRVIAKPSVTSNDM